MRDVARNELALQHLLHARKQRGRYERLVESTKGLIRFLDADRESHSESNTPPVLDTAEQSPRTAPSDPYVTGRGGQDHKYLQHLLCNAAHERGFKADIELLVAGGSVDVAIERRGRRIACEISVTTDADDEARNAAKCLAAGFDQVWLVVTNARRKIARAKALQTKFSADQAARLRVLTAPEALAELDQIAAEPEGDAKQVRGYTVTVRQRSVDPEEARRKRDAIAGILAKSLKGSPPG